MVIKNSADVIAYSCETIKAYVGRKDMDYDKLNDMIIACMSLQRYITLMEEEKRGAYLYGDDGCYKSKACYRNCFDMWKRNAETELKIIDKLILGDDAE